MPQHIEYVVAAYGIWVATFAAYLLWLGHKSRTTRRALERLGTPSEQQPRP